MSDDGRAKVEDEDVAKRPDDRSSERSPPSRRCAGLLGALAVGALLVAAVCAVIPGDAPDQADPNFVDIIFSSRLVIAAARVVLLATALVLLATAPILLAFGFYLFGSILYRLRRGEWLRRAGPFELDGREWKPGEPEDNFEDWWQP